MFKYGDGGQIGDRQTTYSVIYFIIEEALRYMVDNSIGLGDEREKFMDFLYDFYESIKGILMKSQIIF